MRSISTGYNTSSESIDSASEGDKSFEQVDHGAFLVSPCPPKPSGEADPKQLFFGTVAILRELGWPISVQVLGAITYRFLRIVDG
jgi:hypothetical protein